MDEDFSKDKFVFDLMARQYDMLKGKDDSLKELYELCDTDEERQLVGQLIVDFSDMNDDLYNLCLLDMSNYIINKGFPLKECLIVATAHNRYPDSSQDVVQSLKLPLGMAGMDMFNFCNRFDHCFNKDFKKAHHYFVVDDFVGSGSTILNRSIEFYKLIGDKECTLHFVIAAGMEYAINNLIAQNIDIHCSYTLDRGITDRYNKSIVGRKLQLMTHLESKLAAVINQTHLADHHLGYNQTEALFCRHNRNVPNNVFPIFWWKKYLDNSERKTLFTRVQENY